MLINTLMYEQFCGTCLSIILQISTRSVKWKWEQTSLLLDGSVIDGTGYTYFFVCDRYEGTENWLRSLGICLKPCTLVLARDKHVSVSTATTFQGFQECPKMDRNLWWHLNTVTHHISLRMRSPKSSRVYSGPLYKRFRTSDPRRNVMGQEVTTWRWRGSKKTCWFTIPSWLMCRLGVTNKWQYAHSNGTWIAQCVDIQPQRMTCYVCVRYVWCSNTSWMFSREPAGSRLVQVFWRFDVPNMQASFASFGLLRVNYKIL